MCGRQLAQSDKPAQTTPALETATETRDGPCPPVALSRPQHMHRPPAKLLCSIQHSQKSLDRTFVALAFSCKPHAEQQSEPPMASCILEDTSSESDPALPDMVRPHSLAFKLMSEDCAESTESTGKAVNPSHELSTRVSATAHQSCKPARYPFISQTCRFCKQPTVFQVCSGFSAMLPSTTVAGIALGGPLCTNLWWASNA